MSMSIECVLAVVTNRVRKVDNEDSPKVMPAIPMSVPVLLKTAALMSMEHRPLSVRYGSLHCIALGVRET